MYPYSVIPLILTYVKCMYGDPIGCKRYSGCLVELVNRHLVYYPFRLIAQLRFNGLGLGLGLGVGIRVRVLL